MKSLLTLGFAILASGALARGAIITYELTTSFGAQTPSGSVSLQFEDVGLNTVELTVFNNLENDEAGEDQFISGVAFNVVNIDPTAVTFTYVSGPQPASICQSDTNACGINGESGFDLDFDYETANTDERFDSTFATAVYNLSGTDLDATDFIAQSSGGYYAAARIQGIGVGAEGSGRLGDSDGPDLSEPPDGIPEPSSMALIGAGLAALGFHRARRKS